MDFTPGGAIQGSKDYSLTASSTFFPFSKTINFVTCPVLSATNSKVRGASLLKKVVSELG